MKYAILLLPDEKLVDYVNNVKNKVREKFSKKRESFQPHITLRGNFETDVNIELVMSQLKDIANSYEVINLSSKGINIFKNPKLENIIYSLKIEKNPALMEIHKTIIDFVNKVKNEWIDERYNALEGAQRKFVSLYGVPFVLDFFNPHVTLVNTDYFDVTDFELLNSILEDFDGNFDFNCKSIALVEEDDNFSGWKVVAKYDLM